MDGDILGDFGDGLSGYAGLADFLDNDPPLSAYATSNGMDTNQSVPLAEQARSGIGVAWGDGSSVTASASYVPSHSMQPLYSQTTQEAESTLETTLAMNQAYQELIDSMVTRIDYGLQRVREQQKVLQDAIASGQSKAEKKQVKVPVLCYMPPYFKDVAGMTPPANDDKRMKMASAEYDPLVQPPKKWNKTECETLVEAVRSCLIEQRMAPLVYRRDVTQEKVQAYKPSSDSKKKPGSPVRVLREQAKNLDKAIDNIREAPLNELLETENENEVDWMRIAAKDMKGTRSAVECQLQWANELSPRWSKKDWNPKEIRSLKRLVEDEEIDDWDEIALRLGTHRTPFQCLEKYQSELNEQITKRKWEEDEDDRLRDIIESLRLGSYIPWEQVSYYMEGRTRSQCMTRYNRVLDPVLRRGRWSEEEDLLLMVGVQKFGAKDWTKVAGMVPGRTYAQCRERWVFQLDTSNAMEEWTAKEDETLRAVVEKVGKGKWADICKFLPGRNASVCKCRYHYIEGTHRNGVATKRAREPDSDSDSDYDPKKSRREFATKLREIRKNNRKKRLTTVRKVYADFVGAVPESSLHNTSPDDVLDAMPESLSRLITAKLEAINQKYKNKPAEISGAQAARITRTAQTPKANQLAERNKSLTMTAREYSRRTFLNEELVREIAEKQQQLRVESERRQMKEVSCFTQDLYEKNLAGASCSLPPCIGTVSALSILYHPKHAILDKECPPVIKQLAQGNPGPTGSTKAIAAKHYAVLRDQLTTLFRWPKTLSDRAPE